MARSKAPRKRYNPRKCGYRPALITVDETFRIFKPMLDAVDSLRGEVNVARGIPLMRDWSGDLLYMHLIFISWANSFDRLGTNIDGKPLRDLASKLEHGVPVFPEEVDRAEALLLQQRAVYSRLKADDVVSAMRTEQIAVEMSALGIRQ